MGFFLMLLGYCASLAIAVAVIIGSMDYIFPSQSADHARVVAHARAKAPLTDRQITRRLAAEAIRHIE